MNKCIGRAFSGQLKCEDPSAKQSLLPMDQKSNTIQHNPFGSGNNLDLRLNLGYDPSDHIIYYSTRLDEINTMVVKPFFEAVKRKEI